jgi:hypothetical protein
MSQPSHFGGSKPLTASDLFIFTNLAGKVIGKEIVQLFTVAAPPDRFIDPPLQTTGHPYHLCFGLKIYPDKLIISGQSSLEHGNYYNLCGRRRAVSTRPDR